VLADVSRAVLDFPAMAERGRRMIQLAGAGAARYADDEVDETVAFLEWLLQDHFIFLGYREYRIADGTIGGRPRLGLGILADEASSAFARPPPLDACRGHARACARGRPARRLQDKPALHVHRRARMDYVGVRKVAADGA
jgi:glutamate dehydrogenase